MLHSKAGIVSARDGLIVCEVCGNEMRLEDVEIKSDRVRCGLEALTLTYFLCSNCNEVYEVLLADAEYEHLYADFEKAQRRIKKNWGKQPEEVIKRLQEMAESKLRRLKRHADAVSAKYPGRFTVSPAEDGDKDGMTIVYHDDIHGEKGDDSDDR